MVDFFLLLSYFSVTVLRENTEMVYLRLSHFNICIQLIICTTLVS